MSNKNWKKTASKYRTITINHEDLHKNIRHKHTQLLILFFVGILVLVGGSYAYLTTTLRGAKETEIVAGTLKINYKDKNNINLNNAYPMSDTQGMETEPYTFTIENTGNLKGKYEISLEETAGNTLDKSNIRYSLKEGNNAWSEASSLENGIILKSNGELAANQKITYQLKIWLKSDAKNEVQGQTYKAKVVVDVVQENIDNITTTNPVIRLNGESVVELEKGDTYQESGVRDIISKETLNTANVTKRYEYFNGTNTTTVNSVNTNTVGIYYIYYEILDSRGLKGVATRVVNVKRKNATPPVITLTGNNPIVLEYNQAYQEPGYTSIDDEDGNITSKVIVIGKVNKEVPGAYTIKYISEDSQKNISSVTREVIVEKKDKEVSMSSLRVDNWILTSRIDVELDSKADKAYYAIKTKEQKPSDNEYEEMTTKEAGENGYSTFKASKTIYTNGTYYVYTKDSNGEVKEKTIVIDNIDETKPACSFSNIEYVGLNKEATAYLTCTDIVDIKNSTVTKDILDVSDDTLVSIESISTEERIGESAPQGEQKGYKYKIVLKGKKTGVFTLGLKSNKIEDTVGNKNERLEKTNIKVTQITADTDSITLNLTRTNTHQIEITKSYAGDLSYVSANTSIATVSTTGLITGLGIGTTKITVTESNGGATEEIDVTVVKTLDVVLQKGSNVESIGSTALSCVAQTSSGKCSITLPAITPTRGYDVDGWYLETTKVGMPNTSYEIAENKTIIGKAKAQEYTVVYDCNGGSKPTGKLLNATATYDANFAVSTDKCIKEGSTQMYWEDPTGERSWTSWSGKWKYINGQNGIENRTLVLKAIYYTNVEIPTTTYCKSLTYNGSDQTLVNNASTGFSWTSGTTRKVVGSQEVTAHLSTNYIWSDGSLTDKKITCGINTKAVAYTAKNQSKTYDGTALSADATCDLTSGTLVSGHTATCTNTGSQTTAGSSAKTLSSVVIKDANNTDVTSNYTVTKNNGTLTVNAKTLTVTAAAKSKTYGDANPSLTYTYSGNVSGETPAFSGNLTTSATATSNVGAYDITQGTLALTNGTEFTASNYTLSYTKASLTINARATTCTAASKEVTYSGSAVTAPGGSCTNLASGHTATFTNSGSQNGVGTTTNTLTSVVINSGTTDVSINYTITKENGTITVNGMQFTATFSKGSNVSSIGSTSQNCTTTGTNTSCTVSPPSITTSSGYKATAWTRSSGNSSSTSSVAPSSTSGNTYTFAANSITLYGNTTYTTTVEQSAKTVTFYANTGGTFGSSTTNTVKYSMGSGTVTKYSHTSNVDDTGKKNSDYGNSWTNANITGTDRGSTSQAHVVTIPGASSLNVEIYYNGESTSYDWVTIWSGSHPTYTAYDNYSSSGYVVQKLGGSQSGSYTVNGNSLTNMGKSTYTITGDTVTFGFRSDGSQCGQGYGYYAIITGGGSSASISEGTYKEPTKSGYGFIGWTTSSDGSGTVYKEADIASYVSSSTSTSISLYAKYVVSDPPTKPTISASGTSSGQITLSFGSTAELGISKYIVYYGTSSSSMNSSTTVTTTSTSTSTAITGLTNGQIYYFKVEAYDSSGNHSTSDTISKTINVYRYYSSKSNTSVSTGVTSTSTSESVSYMEYKSTNSMFSSVKRDFTYSYYKAKLTRTVSLEQLGAAYVMNPSTYDLVYPQTTGKSVLTTFVKIGSPKYSYNNTIYGLDSHYYRFTYTAKKEDMTFLVENGTSKIIYVQDVDFGSPTLAYFYGGKSTHSWIVTITSTNAYGRKTTIKYTNSEWFNNNNMQISGKTSVHIENDYYNGVTRLSGKFSMYSKIIYYSTSTLYSNSTITYYYSDKNNSVNGRAYYATSYKVE